MLVATLKLLFSRDLNKLKKEVASYQNETNIWRIENSIANSGGNLCLHLIGNLKTYIGAELGKINYTRNRDLEFSLKNISKAALIEKIEETIAIVDQSLDTLTDEDLKNEYPSLVFESKTSTEYFMIHLIAHLSYHLGQINYHRRLLDV